MATGVIAFQHHHPDHPASLVLVVLADAHGRSVGDMYAGAFIPSFILVGLFCLLDLHKSASGGEGAAAAEGGSHRQPRRAVRPMHGVDGAVPGADLHGTGHHDLVGLATPTEGGAMGRSEPWRSRDHVTGATPGSCLRRMDTTLKLTTMVMFILIGSTVFSLTFRGVDGDLWIEGCCRTCQAASSASLCSSNVFVFFLAFFLDYFEIALHHHSAAAPAAGKMGST